MSLIKNLKRREVEIFGAKRVVRNEIKKEETIEKTKKTTRKRKNAEVKYDLTGK